MMYTMRAGVDRQLKDKIAKGLLYGTGLVVAGVIAIAPFTGNNTFWSGRSNSNSAADDTTSQGSGAAKSTGKIRATANQSSSKPTTAAVPPTQSPASKVTIPSTISSTTSPTTSGSTATVLQSTPVVGRGGDGATSTTTQDPLPSTITSPTGTAPAALPITYCTPTTSIDPLLTVNPACVN